MDRAGGAVPCITKDAKFSKITKGQACPTRGQDDESFVFLENFMSLVKMPPSPQKLESIGGH
jgi:hypothetical protein